VYLPQADKPHEEFENIFEQLDANLQSKLAKHTRVIVGGDFNVSLGDGMRADVLQNAAMQHKLSISTCMFRKPFASRWTHRPSKRCIDHILVDKRLKVKDASAVDLLDCVSDHRAVKASVMVLAQRHSWSKPQQQFRAKGWIPPADNNKSPATYQEAVAATMDEARPTSPCELVPLLVACAKKCDARAAVEPVTWKSQHMKDLLTQRRLATCTLHRRQITKKLNHELRKCLRKARAEKAKRVLTKFQNLDQLLAIQTMPVLKVAADQTPAPPIFAKFLEDIYKAEQPEVSELEQLSIDMRELSTEENVPPITKEELLGACRNIKNGKAGDATFLVIEMIKYGPRCLHELLCHMLNHMLKDMAFPKSWYETSLTMIPKKGNLADPGNWRPIAVLDTIYKLFSRIMYERILPIIDPKLAPSQCGFRPGFRLDDALFTVETLLCKAGECNLPVWLALLDMRKAFDRILHETLFAGLRDFGVPKCYINLFRILYTNQYATVNGSSPFAILRGVKQGDVLSPLLFNVALDVALTRWKARLSTHGWLVTAGAERLTDIRYADDILCLAKSPLELQDMLQALVTELEKVGLELNASKSKVMHNFPTDIASLVVAGTALEVLPPDKAEKYLGRKLVLHADHRTSHEVSNRISCAWGAFAKYRSTLTCKQIPIALRMKLFDATVTPCALHGISALTMTQKSHHAFRTAQRKMLRTIVGWTRAPAESWEETMRRMKTKVARAMQTTSSADWDRLVAKRRWLFAHRIAHMSADRWAFQVARWHPRETPDPSLAHTPTRSRGRPRTQWDSNITTFLRYNGMETSWLSHAQQQSVSQWAAMCDAYVDFVCDGY